jgi:hypothetical protein
MAEYENTISSYNGAFMAIKTNKKKKLLLKDDIHNKTAPAAIFATTGPANFKFQNLQLRTYISFKILLLRY